MSLFIRGLGGFGFKGNPVEQIPVPPKRAPCKIVKEKTQPNQAIIYRLSGDTNPLHIDPVLIIIYIRIWQPWVILRSQYCMDCAHMVFVLKVLCKALQKYIYSIENISREMEMH